MKSFNLKKITNSNLIEFRNQLVKESKARSKARAADTRDVNHTTTDADAMQGVVFENNIAEISNLTDIQSALTAALETLSVPLTNSSNHDELTIYVLAIEVLGCILAAASERLREPRTSDIFNSDRLKHLALIIYATLDSGPTALLTKAKIALAELLLLASHLESEVVSSSLLEKITVAPWTSKRTISIFEALLVHLKVGELLVAFRETAEGAAGLLAKLLDGMGISDEIAVLSGRVSIKVIVKVWKEGAVEQDFWIKPLANTLRYSDRGRPNASQHVLGPLFQERKSTLKELLLKGKFMTEFGLSGGMDDIEAVLSILKMANAAGLVEGNETNQLDPNKIRLPSSLLSSCLAQSSTSIPCSALSLIVISATPSLPFPSSCFDLLKSFYRNSVGDESGEFRMRSLSLSGTLMIRLKDSSWKEAKKGNSAYVEEVKSFINWWFTYLLSHLNPASPFRIRINTLRLIDLILQSGLDPTLLPEKSQNGYSSYRMIPKTAVPSSSGSGTYSHGWPFSLSLITARTTFTLLRLLKSTYTALRALAIALLERFPSPLAGYASGMIGDEKVKLELLEPAVEMIKSGREAQASAGAVILGLVYRKWVLEGDSQWDLSSIGNWSGLQGAKRKTSGPVMFSFLNDVMDLAEYQLDLHSTDLARAAATQPMHGTLLTLRHFFVSLPLQGTTTTNAERRVIFLRALEIVERVWEVSSVVLAATAPEGETGTAGNEEERAQGVDLDGEDGEGSGGPIHKLILSATWRAMKEASELLETILRIPAELEVETFKEIWTIAEIRHIGNLYATWLSKVRHRGCMMAIHPTYSRTASTLLTINGWPEAKQLPVTWLNGLLESITSQQISTTRRSAGLPFSFLAIFSAILPSDKTSFTSAFDRLFEISESKSDRISDESRVHAMNTLRTIFSDGKLAKYLVPYVERAFILAISMFWSTRWICRNVAMMLYAALVTRAFGTRRLNLTRDNAALIQRLPIEDFFSRYPSLQSILLKELVFASTEHLNDLPTVDMNSSLFAILMLLSLVQSPNTIGQDVGKMNGFVAAVRECATSRVWKIRDAAADALTGLIPSNQVSTVCLDLLDGIEDCGENEMHGRLIQVQRLLECVSSLPADGQSKIASRIETLSLPILSHRHSFSVRTTFMHLARIFAISTLRLSARLYKTAHQELEASRSWPTTTSYLPSAENFVTACFLLALLYDPSSNTLLLAGLASPFLSIQKETLDFLRTSVNGGSIEDQIAPGLIELAMDPAQAQDCRIQAMKLLANSDLRITNDQEDDTLISELISIHLLTVIVPISQVLLPWIAHLIAQEENPQIDVLLEILDGASAPDQSIELRENAALALLKLSALPRFADPVKHELFSRLTLRLAQDDNPTVRSYASDIITKRWSPGDKFGERKGVELVLRDIGGGGLEVSGEEFKSDVEQVKATTSLLFAVESPNIYQDNLLESELLSTYSIPSSTTVDEVSQCLAQLEFLKEGLETGPLGMISNDVVCKIAYRLIVRFDQLTIKEKKGLSGSQDLIDLLRYTI